MKDGDGGFSIFSFLSTDPFKKKKKTETNKELLLLTSDVCPTQLFYTVTLRLFKACQALYTDFTQYFADFTQYFATVIIHTVAQPTCIILLQCLCAVSY